jgi:hypothetical protein
MHRPASNEYGTFYAGYISLVPEENLHMLLSSSIEELEDQLCLLSEDQAMWQYAPEKWTIAQVLQHLIDTERIFSYRALCIARGENQKLPGFNEEEYARMSSTHIRALADLKNEFIHLRKSVVYFFMGLNDEALVRIGIASEAAVSVRALAYMMIGHSRHHFHILKERYLTRSI